MKRSLVVFSLILLVIGFSVPALTVNATNIGVYYDVVFVDAVCDVENNEQTWTYTITCLVSGAQGTGISHLYFEFKACDPPLSKILRAGVIKDGVEGSVVPGNIGENIMPEGITGIKYDIDDLVGSIEPGESATIWFTLENCWETHCPPDVGIQIYIKAGKVDVGDANGWVCGPNCVQHEIPEVPFGTISIIIAALTAIGIFAGRKRIQLPH